MTGEHESPSTDKSLLTKLFQSSRPPLASFTQTVFAQSTPSMDTSRTGYVTMMCFPTQTKDFADFPSDYPMALQKLKLAYERTSRERGPLPLPVFFHCINALGQRQLGMNIKDILREQCEVRIYGPDTTLSMGEKHNFKLHIALPQAVGYGLITKQIQLGKGLSKPTTKSSLMKKIAKWVEIYYEENEVSMVGVDARVTSDRLRLVGLTWVSSGAAMALLQIVA
ncbi:uncharacterized protein STEHIDRAFT_111182 [Stereum hirsutum FP-91666 SS1]|uniref:uncharacterized protein n=1 Tax=Stereum hirsutum (strain FP-91666) TaxID=721885 RepID=UPI0004409FED|nr:uncharacterized protein STEHIDRAFT_111182 [Stereum hirsutum FP-91666 SS1]EIM86740.1 hypothetical protein STEHIDRAFT_111182 [Stereum hirsutum FP-91666 SS1]